MQYIHTIVAKLFLWYGKRTVISFFVIVILLVLCGIIFKTMSTRDTVRAEEKVKSVEVKSVRELQGETTGLSILGTLESKREARLETEASGRITSVTVKLGDSVRAGRIIASIENSRERAVVLQAEGAYEAAVAASLQSDFGADATARIYAEAKSNVWNMYRTTFTIADNTIRTLTDELFSNPNSQIPGLRIDTSGHAPELVRERVSLGKALEEWKRNLDNKNVFKTEQEMITDAEARTKRLIVFVTTLSEYLADEKPSAQFTEIALHSLIARFSSARAELDQVLQTISTTRNTLTTSQMNFEQAKVGSSQGTVSSADAQVKQALGALRLAQANLEKTIIRTPIGGVVNTLYLKEGSFVGMSLPAALISSDGGFEIKAFVTESDKEYIAVGDEVSLENGEKGMVTEVASAIDPITQKIEIHIGLLDSSTLFTNGQTVTVFLKQKQNKNQTESTALSLPIAAIKMTPDGPVVFIVDADRRLVPQTIILGAIHGDRVVISSGLTADMRIVVDARGLRSGELVDVT